MKSCFRLIPPVFFILSIFGSCTKQFDKAEMLNTLPAAVPSDNKCKPIGFAAAIRQNDGSVTWKNLFLKWYDEAGRLKNIKLSFDWFGGTQCCPEVSIDYGELIYTADEIHVRDIQYGEEIFRIKLDAMKRPVISWYDGHGRAGQYQFDTTYYSYDALNRLASINEHKRFTGSNSTVIETWQFTYDPDGNLVQINQPGKYGGYEFRYDYTQLNQGMVTLHMLSGPIKALEYMDLIKFEQHHRIRAVIVYAESGYPFMAWSYGNFVTDNMGHVTSYTQFSDEPFQRFTWYTAWDCDGSSMITSKNPTSTEFMRLIR